jgi:transposase-like protein
MWKNSRRSVGGRFEHSTINRWVVTYSPQLDAAFYHRQVRYPSNMVEQDHRAVKRITHPMLGLKSLEAAQGTLAGVELMHMIRKGQLVSRAEQALTAAEQVSSLAA